MRYSASHKAATRQRVLEASGALVKREGFAATGVDQLMGAAGLTGGAFYSHFDSKQALLREVIARELQRSRELLLLDGEGAMARGWRGCWTAISPWGTYGIRRQGVRCRALRRKLHGPMWRHALPARTAWLPCSGISPGGSGAARRPGA
ncbi:TetR/AcrR family transcriptional regulator [Cupriavidus basilensis]